MEMFNAMNIKVKLSCPHHEGIEGEQKYDQLNVLAILSCWGTSPCRPLNSSLGVPQSQSRHFVEEKKFLPMPGVQQWIVQPIA